MVTVGQLPHSGDPRRNVASSSPVTVSRTRPEPLRHQIRRAIAAELTSGTYGPGDRLPTEHAYAERFGVSLAPVRQALLDLVASGQLTRTKGRGTFVREAKVEEEITLLLGFTDNLRQHGVPFEIRVLAQALESAGPSTSDALGLAAGAPVVHLRRLALVRGEPAAILEAFLPASRFAPLAEQRGFESGQSLYRRIEEGFGVRLRHAEGTLQVVYVEDQQAELLDIPVGTPGLLVRSVASDAAGEPVESAEVLYRADRFRFRIDRPRVRG
jgi:GntR family transcriptional regulator